MPEFREISRQNPWWTSAAAISDDPHLVALAKAPFCWTPAVFDRLDLTPGGVNTLRGPRQVGKTTTLKRYIERLVKCGEPRVLYYTFDVEHDPAAIAEVIRLAKEMVNVSSGPWYLFLDEVTSVPDWQRGIKYAWDQGLIREDFVLCTGSSGRRMGTEQLPGRRGIGKNYVQLTMSFRDFCRDVRGIVLPDETIDPTQWITKQGRALAKQLYLQMDRLAAAFDIYRIVGGFPAAVRDAVTSNALLPDVSAATLETIWALVANEIVQLRLDPTPALKLVERVGVSLGSTLPWESAADAMGVSGDTAKRYVQALAESFVLLIVYYWSAGGGFEPRKQRKVYFIDPIFARLPMAGISHARSANSDGLIEDLVATALFRSASEHLTQADPSIGSIGYWRSSQGREIDFVVEDAHEATESGKTRQFPIEVKGDAGRGIANAIASIERAFGYGVVVTRETLDWHGQIGVIPAPVFLAGLSERSERRLAIL